MGVPGRVYITTWLFGVSSCVFATARVATPSPSVTLVLDRRPDSAGNHVVDVNREKHDEKRLESQRKRMHESVSHQAVAVSLRSRHTGRDPVSSRPR